MNKKLLLLTLIFVLLASCFSFSACQNELEMDIEDAVVGIDITQKIVQVENIYSSTENKLYWVVKYYVNPELFDLSTVHKVKLKTYIPTDKDYKDGKNVYSKTFTMHLPDDVAPTVENNYFFIELEQEDYHPIKNRTYDYSIGQYLDDNYYFDADGTKHYYPNEYLIILDCFAYVYEAHGSEDEETQPGVNRIPSIGMTFLIGLAMAVVGFILYWITAIVFNNKIFVAIAFATPIILTITSYFSWGIGRGIIMTVFYAIYYAGVAIFNKRLAENLGY